MPQRTSRFPRRVVRSAPVLLVLAVLLALVARRVGNGPQRPRFDFDATSPRIVKRIVDGDTLLLDDGTRVRLLGVDTPETKAPNRPVEPLGPEASEFTRRFVASGPVLLEFDRERHDEYGRVLAYVHVDGRCLNEELIRAGLSRAITRFPYREAMKRRFRAAEEEAREAGRGIWAR